VQALLRWRGPGAGNGLIRGHPLARSIPTLESTGLILDAGRWALDIPRATPSSGSAKDSSRRALPSTSPPLQPRALLLDIGVITPLLDIELTEAVLLDNPEAAIRPVAGDVLKIDVHSRSGNLNNRTIVSGVSQRTLSRVG
jgi:hypothetical protein